MFPFIAITLKVFMMSEELKPEILEGQISDVAREGEATGAQAGPAVAADVEPAAQSAGPVSPADLMAGLSDKTLAELSSVFEELMSDEGRMKRFKEAEAIKAAFYKKLSKLKADSGAPEDGGSPGSDAETPENAAEEILTNPFQAIEDGFKALYSRFREERAEFTRKIDAERADNLIAKQEVVSQLKELVDRQEDVSALFPEFRSLQSRWREIGPVPPTDFRVLNDTYQFYVEKFYDKIQLDRELRDLDFKKNLEAKEELCEMAEKLAEHPVVVEAFRELQKLHEQWKEYGPVAKEFRESIWERFRAATSVINKKYQEYFEGQKEKQAENLKAKTALCEEVEAIASREDIKSSQEWNNLSKEIARIQAEWRGIGFATKKENQKIYDRFRAACDKFYERKRVFYAGFKDDMMENLQKKLAIIEEAELLKTSTDWKKTTEAFLALQKRWKEIGSVPRKRSEQIWKRFRAACDEFFTERDKNFKPENDFYGNLRAKKALVQEILAYESSDDEQVNKDAFEVYRQKWSAIGFVPFKEKDAIAKAFKEAMDAKFPEYMAEPSYPSRRQSRSKLSEKDLLVQKYNKLQQEIDTYENNIGFFAASKNSAAMISSMQENIAKAKEELKALEEKIRQMETEEN